MNHQPIVFPGDAKKDGETDIQHQVRMANNAKARAYHIAQREKRRASEAREKEIAKAGMPRAPGPLLGEVKEVIPIPIRGYELPEPEEVLPLSPPTIIASPMVVPDAMTEFSIKASEWVKTLDLESAQGLVHLSLLDEKKHEYEINTLKQKIDRLYSRLQAIKNYTAAI